ncbi:toll-like receptor 13 [Galleria mellonella]|uniref:Toll-like receptor 13 n=1 Tax=Galleria mellonella TaxID=7137 RepID=A0ABM3MD23_GALME|nr:toll-like receptor 13 [Galleria mellonella]
MILKILVFCCILPAIALPKDPTVCLTGYMTDVQKWVDEFGTLTVEPNELDRSIDLSTNTNVVTMLQKNLQSPYRSNADIRYLSLARCNLERVPPVFDQRDTNGRPLRQTVEYLTLYGNNFKDISAPGVQYDIMLNATDVVETHLEYAKFGEKSIWSTGFQYTTFAVLREFDLRACSIEFINGLIFKGMPNLEALYLGENNIKYIHGKAFVGLNNLIHLDLSRNKAYDKNGGLTSVTMESADLFERMSKLRSLDLSFTEMGRNVRVLSGLGKEFQRLSLCGSKVRSVPEKALSGTSMKYLDISGNYGILENSNILAGLEDTLEILYANEVGFEHFHYLYKFSKLEVLKLTNNEVMLITKRVVASLTSLKVLDLERNRFGSWIPPIFSTMPNLRFLSLKDNNLNLISAEIIDDIANISYVSLSGNNVVCNCHSREFIDLAARNDNEQKQTLIDLSIHTDNNTLKAIDYHIAESEFNSMIELRANISTICDTEKCKKYYVDRDHRFLIIDYDIHSYVCFHEYKNRFMSFINVKTCKDWQRSLEKVRNLDTSTNLVLLLTLPTTLLLLLLIIFIYRRKFGYFFVTMRNSATLSLISRTDINEEGKIYNYDVFVSYCNGDRNWMLDHLLPHLETECSVSVCLHERDFQVGLSILENIVSCMDRSRTIMLVISKQFLRSQWCQFEMHLAQHRLLETRREDLILVLLEEIPRSLRPTTLHYLMLTKTYIVWPKVSSEQTVFWKRLKKSLVVQQRKYKNTTLA